ncbi:Clp protease N-terminal domain-containing protein [Rugosimonospora acidiphila]|uniref:Clp protease N-terminal domain-containing protein n=1 Tax=Rugosimonospora acidiphila TaxID=556531 RepID=A0ABP9SHH5_9ACTN
MFERFTESARDVVTGAQREARALGHRHLGTEHLLLGVLRGPDDDLAVRVLREAGIGPDRVRAEIDRLAGSELDPLGAGDAAALQSIGIDLDAVRMKIEETFGPGALEEPAPVRPRRWPRRGGNAAVAPAPSDSRHIPLTPHAKKALELSLREALRLRDRHIGTEHLLLGLLRGGEGLAVRVLTEAGVTVDGLRARVESAMGEAA